MECELNLNPIQKATLVEGNNLAKKYFGYELKYPKEYVSKNPYFKLEYIDISVFGNGKDNFINGLKGGLVRDLKQISQIPELLEIFLNVLDGGISSFMQFNKRSVKEIYQNSEFMEKFSELLRNPEALENMKQFYSENEIQALKQVYNPERDEFMSTRIRELFNNRNDKLVAIVGLAHLPGIKSKISDLNPRIIRLDQYADV